MGCLLRWFMHFGEFTCPSLASFTEDMLTPGDVADSRDNPSYITLRLKRYPFGVGVTLHLEVQFVQSPLCWATWPAARPHQGHASSSQMGPIVTALTHPGITSRSSVGWHGQPPSKGHPGIKHYTYVTCKELVHVWGYEVCPLIIMTLFP